MSADEELTSIRNRLTRLERQSRRLRVSAVVLALCLVGTVAIGQAPADKPKTIEAQEFIVRDQQGRLSAKLATSTYGTVLSFHQGELPPGVIEQKMMELGVLGDQENALRLLAGEEIWDQLSTEDRPQYERLLGGKRPARR